MDKTKILLVSDVHHFSTIDIYNGYTDAFKKLGIPFDVVPIHDLVNIASIMHMSLEGAFGMALAKLLMKTNEFTHCVCISGLSLPQWFWQSMYDKKLCVIASDDPHASQILKKQEQYIDYWFSNEKNLKGDKIFYLPTATNSFLPTVSKSEISDNFKSDIVFVGTVYDDRIKPLEDLCHYCRKNSLKLKIIGPLLSTNKDSIVRQYATEVITNNMDTKLYYRGSRIAINIDRNIHWNASEEEGNSLLVDVGEPYSINPRAYEIAGCRTTQLYINPRQEAFDIFGDNIYYSSYNNIEESLDKILKEDQDIILNKITNSYRNVLDNHTYVHRVRKLMEYLN